MCDAFDWKRRFLCCFSIAVLFFGKALPLAAQNSSPDFSPGVSPAVRGVRFSQLEFDLSKTSNNSDLPSAKSPTTAPSKLNESIFYQKVVRPVGEPRVLPKPLASTTVPILSAQEKWESKAKLASQTSSAANYAIKIVNTETLLKEGVQKKEAVPAATDETTPPATEATPTSTNTPAPESTAVAPYLQ